jgi:uncharacterized protein (UPF0333 family)
MMKRGQGAFEYILMLSGVLLIVILIIFILQGTLSGTNNTIGAQQNTYNTAVSADIVPQYTKNLTVTSATGGINGPQYPCCAIQNGTIYVDATHQGTSNCNISGLSIPACNKNLSCPSSKFDRKQGRCA